MTDTPRKRGRPKIDKPPKISQRPKAIEDAETLGAVRLTHRQMAALDNLAANQDLPSRAAAVRFLIEEYLP